ncbi:MAG: hypothetical protein K1X55_08965 [Chitinophagales bacterium]|nr:hypothetical protein [Chitinophagales bacterium]
MRQELAIGSKVEHPKFGAGVIIDDSNIQTYTIYFPEKGEVDISKDFDGLVIVKLVEKDPDAVSLDDVRKILSKIIEPLVAPLEKVAIADKWIGGTLVFNPGKRDLQSKEMPIDQFFHKIVMTRDRLRVMEQKINASNLADDEKVDLQQYITRIYGSLTSFNILFRDKEDHFKGTGS